MGRRKVYIGKVLSNKMKKTIVVGTTLQAKHPKYGRIVKRYNKFKAHDENNSANPGDMVRIEETRPVSKDKRFRLVEIVKRATVAEVEIKE